MTAITKLASNHEIEKPNTALKLVESCYEKKLSQMNRNDPKEYNNVLGKVSRWRMMIGALDSTPAQLSVEVTYLMEVWPNVTLSDIDLMVELLLTQSLDFSMPYVINFSPLFMGQVLASYFRYKADVINKVNENMQIDAPKQTVSVKDRIENIKECIQICHDHCRADFKERFFNGIVYNFLRKTKRLVFDDQIIAEAKEYAKKRYGVHIATKTPVQSLADAMQQTPAIRDTKDNALRQYTLDYCLKWFFDHNEVQKVIASISEKEWQDEASK